MTAQGRFLLINSRTAMSILKVKAVSAIEAPIMITDPCDHGVELADQDCRNSATLPNLPPQGWSALARTTMLEAASRRAIHQQWTLHAAGCHRVPSA